MSDLIRHLTDVGFDPLPPVERAWALWSSFRLAQGLTAHAVPLLTAPGGNVKLAKGHAAIYGLSLTPWTFSGHNVCRQASPECQAGCVAFSGRGGQPHVIAGRTAKTRFLAEHPSSFMAILMFEIAAVAVEATEHQSSVLAIRLNAFSDLPWESLYPPLIESYPGIQFYDYTKWTARRSLPNYHLTYSADERWTFAAIERQVRMGENVAVIFRVAQASPLPNSWRELTVIDGDVDDQRWEDPRGVVVGLRAKGWMRVGHWDAVKDPAGHETPGLPLGVRRQQPRERLGG